MSDFKSGVSRLAKKYPDVPIIPIYLQGAGRSLPKGKKMLVPFVCTAVIGEKVAFLEDKAQFMTDLRASLDQLQMEAPPLHWKEDQD